MALRGGSVSRSLMAAAGRAFQSHPSRPSSISPIRPSSSSIGSYLLDSRRPFISFTCSRGILGCMESLLPLHSVIADTHLTSHISIHSRSCCQLSQGT